ncbi:DNA topoisomerase IB [Chelativorans alearense]|uniref:DNA topoisomerase IB n=1 Tax=Chelativorans alearense TaxID=2681495 RepID=UPI0031B5CBF3
MRRRKAGRGLAYVSPTGQRIADRATLARIRSLAIPPAWTDVWISPDPSGHIQATGRDQAGRKQYRYHPAWLACRDEAKFSSLVAFAEALPRLRARVRADLARHGLPRERVVAAVVWLLDHTMMRIGNDIYARRNKSFGLTTLETRHLRIDGPQLRFSFIGKSGREWKVKLVDRRIASIVRTIQELPGQHLFQYLDADRTRQPIHSHDVNEYIRETIGSQFTSKHFRTWGGTTAAAFLLAQEAPPDSKRKATRVLNSIIDHVARKLRNTRAICRQGYIHPAILERWRQWRLAGDFRALRRRHPKPLKGLSRDESLVLHWLRAAEGN